MTDYILLKLKGTPIANPTLPGVFSDSSRGATATEGDPVFARRIPQDQRRIRRESARALESGSAPSTTRRQTEDKDVVVLEMADGVTVITSARKLRESLRRIDPAAVEADGTLQASTRCTSAARRRAG